MCRLAGESARRNTYVPAGRVVPGSDTGPLNVTLVSRSVGCETASAAVSSVAANAAVSVEEIRLISYVLLRRCSAKKGAQRVPVEGELNYFGGYPLEWVFTPSRLMPTWTTLASLLDSGLL
jgi:hypothetical protein